MTPQSVAASADLPDLVPARMLNEFAYCPRLFYLEWVESQWEESADTVDGDRVHRRVDREGGRLPEARGSGGRDDDAADDGKSEPLETFHARSVLLSAPREGLIARCDLLEGEGNRVTPVDYKRGKRPDVPEGAWEPERVQVCAQGLILRENGYEVDEGILYFAGSRERVSITFDDVLVARTRALLREARRAAVADRPPPPLVDSPKCPRCSLAPLCLPDEIGHGEGVESGSDDGVRRLFPPRPEALPLYVQSQGHRIGVSGDVLQVKSRREVVQEARIRTTSQVSVFGAVQLSTQAMQAMMRAGVPLCFFSYGGWFYGMARGHDHKNVLVRIAQHAAATDGTRALSIARRLVETKIRNARTLLRRNLDGPDDERLRRLKILAKDAARAPSRETLLGLEGTAARLYFEAFPRLMKPRGAAEDEAKGEGGMTFDMAGRNRRPPTDPANALLSFAYALLAKDLTLTLQAVGFDPYVGFYHQPRYGRPALALDLMEEYRPIIADSVVLTAINTGVVSPRSFLRRGNAVALTPSGRKAFLQAYERRMDELVTHPVFGYRLSYRRLLDVQARLLARHLLGELDEPPTFRTR